METAVAAAAPLFVLGKGSLEHLNWLWSLTGTGFWESMATTINEHHLSFGLGELTSYLKDPWWVDPGSSEALRHTSQEMDLRPWLFLGLCTTTYSYFLLLGAVSHVPPYPRASPPQGKFQGWVRGAILWCWPLPISSGILRAPSPSGSSPHFLVLLSSSSFGIPPSLN